MFKNSEKYFKNHPGVNSFVHMLGGIGIGVLIASPIANPHPIRFGISFLILAVIGHVYAGYQKK